MSFFNEITTEKIIGIALLAAGAVITFASRAISSRAKHKHANLITKCIGLAIVFAGFALIMFI